LAKIRAFGWEKLRVNLRKDLVGPFRGNGRVWEAEFGQLRDGVWKRDRVELKSQLQVGSESFHS